MEEGFEAFGEILDRKLLVLEARTILVIEPTKLLENLCMSRVISHNTFISILGLNMLSMRQFRPRH